MKPKDYQAWERELTAEREQGEEFVVYAEGLLYASVCSSLPQEEVIQRMGHVTSGTQAGWVFSDHSAFASGQPNPCPCDKKPETHKHYLFNC